MVKVKLSMFEAFCVCFATPVIGVFFAIVLLVLDFFDGVFFRYIKLIVFICCISIILLILSILLCYIIIRKSKREIIFDKTRIVLKDNIPESMYRYTFKEKLYEIEQIDCCEYTVCKWYKIPVESFLQYAGLSNGGLLIIKFQDGNLPLKVRILYKDYKKIKPYLKNIKEL